MSERQLLKMRQFITKTLIKVGIRCDLRGFNYLSYAIELVIQDPTLIHGVCKGLYVKVSEHFNVEHPGNIERNIRHAIDTTYLCKNFDGLNEIIGRVLYTIKDKPTAGELIRLVAEFYHVYALQEQEKEEALG